MIKRILMASAIIVLAFGICVTAAHAYTDLKTPAAISATATVVGTTELLTVAAVDQSTGLNTTISFPTTPIGIFDSGRAIKIQTGTNVLNNRIIVYTDVNTNTTPDVPSTGNPATGVDGGGMVGRTAAAYSVALFWGVNSAANGNPNVNVNYTFDGNMNDGIGEVYIVDKRHTHTFCPGGPGTGLDNTALYKFDGTTVTNTANDGLYPQYWDIDLYDSPTDHTSVHLVSQALYKNIATVAFGISSTATASAYVCSVPKLTTAATDDSVTANLGPSPSGAAIYIYIGGDFVGKPAQVYGTNKLMIGIVQDS